jgi:uncharacterized protein DUF4956
MNELDRWMQDFSQASSPADNGWRTVALTLLLAFFLGQAIAWVYVWTHSSLSYSRTFTQSLVLLTMIVALIIHVIGDQLVTAFGLIGALAIIRFRNVLKDTRDTVFIFFTIVVGMATGSHKHFAAIGGAVVLLATTIYLHGTGFGTRGVVDGHLTCRLSREALARLRVEFRGALDRFCRVVRQVTVHDTGKDLEYVYEVRLRDRARSNELVDELRALEGVAEVVFVMRDQQVEV